MSWSGSVASGSSWGSRQRRPRPMERMLFARTHKAAMEEALVRRREAERVRGEFWSGAANNLVIFSFPLPSIGTRKLRRMLNLLRQF